MNIFEVLRHYADDSRLEITSYNNEWLRLRLTLDSAGGITYKVAIPKPIHIDMPPIVMLGQVEFGDRSLLPRHYSKTRYRGYEGDENTFRIMKITDDKENHYFVVYYEKEVIEPNRD